MQSQTAKRSGPGGHWRPAVRFCWEAWGTERAGLGAGYTPTTAGTGLSVCHAGRRAIALPGTPAGTGAGMAKAAFADPGLQRRPCASDNRGQRSVSDAVAVGAVRAEPDVQPALRDGAGRARRRRFERYRI